MAQIPGSPPQEVDVCGLAQVSGKGGQVGKANTANNVKHVTVPGWVLCGAGNPDPPPQLTHLLSAVDFFRPRGPPTRHARPLASPIGSRPESSL